MSGAARGARVIVVTGGGGGIGAAIAEELGRTGHHVVTMDPLVTVDGAESLPAVEETTAGRIVAAGGSAESSSVSVTDRDAVTALFADLHARHGRVDGVVNVAGITRPTSFTRGTEADWLGVLSVHLDGYRNVLGAALPLMAAAGHGRVLGVTSGSGWRAADAGAYGCAKRAVASLTWQLGRVAPDGVAVNAMSPIAMTRMVTAALARARAAASAPSGGRPASTGGLSLSSMPAPEELGPFAAHLVGADLDWCRGEIFFAGGSEVAVVEPPRLLEVVRTADARSLPHVLDRFARQALGPAHVAQATTGATNPRFGGLFDEGPDERDRPPAAARCAVVTHRSAASSDLAAALVARGVEVVPVDASSVAPGFAGAAAALDAAASTGPIEAVAVAVGDQPAVPAGAAWEQVLAGHAGIAEQIHADASWSRAVADHAAATGRPVRLVLVVGASGSGGRTRAQAATQLARAARGATDEAVGSFVVAVEGATGPAGVVAAELAAHLVADDGASQLAGAELVVGDGWLGLRSHPRPTGAVTFGGPAVPAWLDPVLREAVDPRHPTPWPQARPGRAGDHPEQEVR